MTNEVHPNIKVRQEDGKGLVERPNDERENRALHGLTRALIANMVQGVTQGFKKELEIVGVGYRAEISGNVLTLILGYSHPVKFVLPEGIKGKVDKQTIILEGINKELLGQTAARIRSLRKPDSYKGKGVRYLGEMIKTKVGKSGVK